MSIIDIVNGAHNPALPFVIIDRQGLHVDLSAVQGELWYPNTVARITWAPIGNRMGGRITLKNGTVRTFVDETLLLPYVKAYKDQKATLDQQIADAAAGQA